MGTVDFGYRVVIASDAVCSSFRLAADCGAPTKRKRSSTLGAAWRGPSCLPHRTKQTIGPPTECDDSNTSERPYETRGVIVQRDAPPLRIAEMLVGKKPKPKHSAEHND